MKKTLLVSTAVLLLAAFWPVAASIGNVYVDLFRASGFPNPAAGSSRLSVNPTSKLFTCINDDGSSCTPLGTPGPPGPPGPAGPAGGQDLFLESRALWGGTPGNQKTEHAAVPGGGTITILNSSGSAGYLSTLWFGITGNQNNMVNSILTITVDGEATPAISSRIPLFFGAEYCWNTNNFGSRFIGCQQNGGSNIGYYSYIPVPFSNSISVTLTNGDSSNGMTVWAEANYTTGVADTWPLAKKLWFSSGTVTGLTVNTVQTLVNAASLNPGRLFGVYMSIDSFPGGASPSAGPLEGNVKFYFDGSATPNFESSGTEDYFHFSNYFENVPSGFTTDYTGVPFKSGVTWNAFRFHLYDPMTFTNALKATWNAGDSSEAGGFSGGVRLAYGVWYYTQ